MTHFALVTRKDAQNVVEHDVLEVFVDRDLQVYEEVTSHHGVGDLFEVVFEEGGFFID